MREIEFRGKQLEDIRETNKTYASKKGKISKLFKQLEEELK